MSNQQKWTKGPWVVDGCGIYREGHDFDSVVDYIRDEFDANLIAAAPDLYEALENLVSELEDIRGISVAEYKVDAWNIAKSALAKARGENE